jgi:tetratricopeptide (TPR) repeat protein
VKKYSSGWKKRHELAEVHLLMGNQAEALKCLEQVLKRQAHRIDHRLQLAHLLHAAGKSSEAARILSAGLQHTRRAATRIHIQAWQSFYNGETEEGVNQMKHAVITEPAERNHLISLAKMLQLCGQNFGAWEVAQAALRLDHTDAEAIWLARTSLRQSGALTLLRGLEDHLAAYSQDTLLQMEISLRRKMGSADLNPAEFDQMRKDIRHFGQASRWSCEWAEVKARFFWKRGRISRCISFVRKYAADYETCVDAQLIMLRWLMRTGKYQSAATAAALLPGKFPDDLRVVTMALHCLTSAEADAATAFALTAQFDSHPVALQARAHSSLTAGDWQGALGSAIRLTAQYPDHTQGWLLKAKAEFLMGRYDSAKTSIRSCWNSPVMGWSPFLAAEAALLMGRILEHEAGSSAAEEWREMAARIASGEEKAHPALSHHYRSLALSALGDRKGAALFKEKSLEAGIWYPQK